MSIKNPLGAQPRPGHEFATLGGGCFWCLEAVYEELQGVVDVESGYAGGRVANPTYRQVCDGDTGHAEVVRIEFDPAHILYREILEVFFSIPGLGREVLLAVNRSDYPVIQAVTVYLAALTMVINLSADMLYKWVDPRVALK